jgi:hypothetical protein
VTRQVDERFTCLRKKRKKIGTDDGSIIDQLDKINREKTVYRKLFYLFGRKKRRKK